MKHEIEKVFEFFYLSSPKKSISQCMDLTEQALEKDNPEMLPIPSYEEFENFVEEIPMEEKEYFRRDPQRLDFMTIAKRHFRNTIIVCPCCYGKVSFEELIMKEK